MQAATSAPRRRRLAPRLAATRAPGAALGTARGFTLVELMTALTVGSIALAFAVPSMQTFVQEQRLTSQTNTLLVALNLARSEAIKRASAAGVRVCASTNQATCNATDWSLGWAVVDVATGTPLFGAPAVGGNNTIREAGAQRSVTFLSTGAAQAAASFTVCDARGASKAHSLDVSPMGRAMAATSAGYDVNNAALVCP